MPRDRALTSRSRTDSPNAVYNLTGPSKERQPAPIELAEQNSNVLKGNGSPEGNVAAPVGSIYRRLDGGAGTTFYVKETGTAKAGWVAK